MKNPLVSIIIITYNSSKFVLETLDSAYNQTYHNLELIVSDDCSTDETSSIVREWIKSNKERFVRCEFVESHINTGIPANCNRGIKRSRGEWIRFIAGDDILIEDSIEKQVMFASDNINIFIGDIIKFRETNNVREYIKSGRANDYAPWFFELDALHQYRFLMRHYDFGLGLATFVKRELYEKVTMYDERYVLEEDTFFQLMLTKNGVRYYYLAEPLMYYRVHDSVSCRMDSRLYNVGYEETKQMVRKEMIYPAIPWYDLVYWETEIVDYLTYFLAIKLFKNRKTNISAIFVKTMNKFRLLNHWNSLTDKVKRELWLRSHHNKK